MDKPFFVMIHSPQSTIAMPLLDDELQVMFFETTGEAIATMKQRREFLALPIQFEVHEVGKGTSYLIFKDEGATK